MERDGPCPCTQQVGLVLVLTLWLLSLKHTRKPHLHHGVLGVCRRFFRTLVRSLQPRQPQVLGFCRWISRDSGRV